MLEGEYLVELLLELAHEALFIVLCPFPAGRVRAVFGGWGLVGGLETGFEVVVGDVGVVVVLDEGASKLLTEPGG